MSRFFLLTLCFFTAQAHAYIRYNPNEKLAEQVANESWRILPRGDHYSLAVDADFFKPAFFGSDQTNYYKYDFYHGNGYWIDLRTEFKPVPDLALNLKIDVTHGTSSNGPGYQALLIPHGAITFRKPDLLGMNWETRLSDLARQTVGNGLFIEEKDVEGGYLLAEAGDFRGKVMVDGTGNFRLEGGVITFDLSFWNHLVGATGFIQEIDTDFSPPQLMGTLYSRKSWSNGFSYGLELGGDQAGVAGLSYVEWTGALSQFQFSFKPQVRHYGRGLLGTLPGRVQHLYVAYDQNDKPYTNFMNIYSYGDNVNTYSMLMNFEYEANSFYKIYAEPEILRFQYQDRASVQAIYFRTGFKFYPFKNRMDEIGVLVGNKYLIASTNSRNSTVIRAYSDPMTVDLENKPQFIMQTYGMINFSTHF